MNAKTQNHEASSRPVILWLIATAGLVFLMVIVGAITRLTESGLSMVEWRPLIGALPPMTDTEWERVFSLYQETPEFQKKNFWMEIDQFKNIFFWEWFHRLLGRLIGLAYGVPLLFFWLRGIIPQGYKLPLFLMLLLGGAQGLMGWFMVESGLVDVPSVSHYRLAAHLSLAFLIFCLLIWLAMSIKNVTRKPNKALLAHSWVVLGSLVITIFWGAYTAGLDAGMVYNDSYPLMGGQFVPPDMWHYTPAWLNFFEHPSGVQFTHRWLAFITMFMVLSLLAHAQMKHHYMPVIYALGFMVFVQFGLGIITLLSGVNIILATMHQAGALILLMLLVMTIYQLKPRKKTG